MIPMMTKEHKNYKQPDVFIPSLQPTAPREAELLDLFLIEWDDADPLVRISLPEGVVFSWWDDNNVRYPEQLCWEREIRRIFVAGVAAGMRLAKKD